MTDTEHQHLTIVRPVTRGDCGDVPRPCAFVGCRFNLLLDVKPNGTITFNATGASAPPTAGCEDSDEDFDAIAERATDAWAAADGLRSCALDVVDAQLSDETPLAEVALALGVTRQRADQIITRALPKLVGKLSEYGGAK